MLLSDFIAKLKLAHDVPNYYNNHFPKNLGYYDGSRFSFDCWNLIKAVLSGWTDNRTPGYYIHTDQLVTGDIDGYTMLKKCSGRSKDFSKLRQPGTYLYIYKSPHAGIYLGDFEIDGYWFNVVECTGAWESKVQYTYVDEKGGRYLYKGGSKSTYSWEEYGLLPWVEYGEPKPIPDPTPVSSVAYGVDFSPVFNPTYYADRYSDLEQAFGHDESLLWQHFTTFGMIEARQASEEFNVTIYRDRYEDLQRVYGDDLPLYYRHYCYFGKNEGRSGV